ncbi:MAG: H-type small acid-soluble spore protein [Ectobacillus sp.]
MNIARAKEISESGKTVSVSYQGMPIMIQHIDEKNETARIYAVHNPEQEYTVPISSLTEE